MNSTGTCEFPETRFDHIDDMSGGAIAGIDDQLQRLELRWLDVAQQVLDIGLQN